MPENDEEARISGLPSHSLLPFPASGDVQMEQFLPPVALRRSGLEQPLHTCSVNEGKTFINVKQIYLVVHVIIQEAHYLR